MSLVAVKLAAAAVLLVSALLLGLLPFWLLRRLRGDAGGRPRYQLVISCVQCFGGGVLLATVFAHMLPELHESLATARPGSNFPLAEVLVCAGMFSIYAVEELVELGIHAGDSGWAAGLGIAEKSTYGTLDSVTASQGDSHHGHSHGLPPDGLSGFRVLVVAVALSAHSVFEGMAIGLDSHTDSVWLLTAAIACHKAIISFCLGEQLAASPHRARRALVFLLVFVLAAPSGVLLGVLVTATGSSGSPDAMLTNVLQALAAGSILYVVIFEVIQGERAKPGSGLVKLCAILAGFVFMVVVSQLLEGGDAAAGKPPTQSPVTVGPEPPPDAVVEQ